MKTVVNMNTQKDMLNFVLKESLKFNEGQHNKNKTSPYQMKNFHDSSTQD